MFKQLKIVVYISAMCLSFNLYAADCKVSQKASEGAAEAQAQGEKEIDDLFGKLDNAADILGTCTTSISSIKLPSVSFPDISSILDGVLKKVCKIANDKIDDVYNDVVNEVNGSLQDIMNGVENKVDGAIDDSINKAGNAVNRSVSSVSESVTNSVNETVTQPISDASTTLDSSIYQAIGR